MGREFTDITLVLNLFKHCMEQISRSEERILVFVIMLYFGFLIMAFVLKNRQIKIRKELNHMKEQIELLTKVCMSNHQNQDPLGEQNFNTEKN